MDLLSEFVVEQVLQSNPEEKEMVVKGAIRNQPCLVKLRRLALPELKLGQPLPIANAKKIDSNEVYSWGTCDLLEENSSFVNCVYPATEQHIAKYLSGEPEVVVETGKQYLEKTAKYIATQREHQIEWVRAILYRNAEAADVLLRTPDFVLLPNSKWDRKTVPELCMLALAGPMQAHIASIRDLTSEHIPLLNEMERMIGDLVESKYNLKRTSIKLFFHYPPTYYHLHLHVTHVDLRSGSDFGRCVFLQQVRAMLEVKPMREWDLTFVAGGDHPVVKLLSN